MSKKIKAKKVTGIRPQPVFDENIFNIGSAWSFVIYDHVKKNSSITRNVIGLLKGLRKNNTVAVFAYFLVGDDGEGHLKMFTLDINDIDKHSLIKLGHDTLRPLKIKNKKKKGKESNGKKK